MTQMKDTCPELVGAHGGSEPGIGCMHELPNVLRAVRVPQELDAQDIGCRCKGRYEATLLFKAPVFKNLLQVTAA